MALLAKAYHEWAHISGSQLSSTWVVLQLIQLRWFDWVLQ